jgi:GTP-binding protein HflX
MVLSNLRDFIPKVTWRHRLDGLTPGSIASTSCRSWANRTQTSQFDESIIPRGIGGLYRSSKESIGSSHLIPYPADWTEPLSTLALLRTSEPLGETLTKALLILFPDKYVEEEAVALAEAGGYEPVAKLTQRYLDRARYGIGEGKAEEAATVVREKEVGTILFDGRLNASQTYGLAKLCKVEVKDREKLILEIFAKRAFTAEAKLQVELAELQYELPRARDKVRKAKSGEQPGFFGLGKYEVDVYVRMMKRRVATLKRKVEEVRERRELLMNRRIETGHPTVALTGYTGAGKTTLFNRLTGESKEVDAGVFTTLSPTTRGIDIGKERVLVSDTVGFISRLPPFLVEAFKSTLEEASFAAVVLLLIDASQPPEKIATSYQSCIRTLAELGVPETRILTVMNKADLVGDEELGEKMWNLGVKEAVGISAKTGSGLAELFHEISRRMQQGRMEGRSVEAD